MVSTGVGVPRLEKIKVASGPNDVFRNPQSVPVVETDLCTNVYNVECLEILFTIAASRLIDLLNICLIFL